LSFGLRRSFAAGAEAHLTGPLAMAPAVTAEMAKGFTRRMVKVMMSGRGDEPIDLAKTNLWR
jgi:hypothetical protein